MHELLRRGMVLGAALATLVTLALPLGAEARTAGPAARFGQPVKVTPDLGYGYEPTVVVDPFGNVFSTAHKENWQLLLAPDPDSPTYTRSMSWDWVSVDEGHTFVDIPGLTAASLEQHEFGDEGDMALDEANHLYFVDTNVVDDTIVRWTVTGHTLDDITLDFTRPLIPTKEAVDDRPWIVAHGNSDAFYFGNDGTKLGDGARYTVYVSHDGGMTFDLGTKLPDSGWCRPAADHRPGSPYVYALCTNDNGKLYSYVSADNGGSWTRFDVGTYNGADETQSYPLVVVAPNGTVWGLYVDAVELDPNGIPTKSKLRLFRSVDNGRTWVDMDITPKAMQGHYEYAWLAVSPRNSSILGMGVYFRPDGDSDWYYYGAAWKAGRIPTLVNIAPDNASADASEPEPPGDYTGSYFGPDGKLSLVWTDLELRIAPFVALRTIFYVRST